MALTGSTARANARPKPANGRRNASAFRASEAVTEFKVSANVEARPVHPDITEDKLSRLVDEFYERGFADPRLGPIFMKRIGVDRSAHMRTIKQFWSSVLLKTRSYSGQPVPVHLKLTEVQREDFSIWLDYWRATANETFEPEAAALDVTSAERIAESLKLAMFGSPELFEKKR
jgi:hemoglobin